MMNLRLRPAIIGAVCVFAIGGSAAAQAGRVVLAGSGTPSPTGNFTCVHEDHGRIDNSCSGISAPDLNWNVPLPSGGNALGAFFESRTGSGQWGAFLVFAGSLRCDLLRIFPPLR